MHNINGHVILPVAEYKALRAQAARAQQLSGLLSIERASWPPVGERELTCSFDKHVLHAIIMDVLHERYPAERLQTYRVIDDPDDLSVSSVVIAKERKQESTEDKED